MSVSSSLSRLSSLGLYKTMLREADKFTDFNFRSYARRRIRDGFRSAKSLDAKEATAQFKFAAENLDLIRRQTVVGHLFGSGQKLSVEVIPKPTSA